MLKSNFIKPKLNIEFFGKTRFWVGLFLGLGYGFLLYCFFNILNLGFHYFCYMNGANFIISNPLESQFNHFLFAFSAFLFGQNAFFEFTLSKSKFFRKDTSKKFTILYHSRMITWFTLFVGFNFCITFKLLAFSEVFLLFDFFKVGWWTGILVMIWLHFYMWMKISKYFREVYPISISLFFLISILSFGLSNYDPVSSADDYRHSYKHLMHYKLKITPPDSSPMVSSKLRHKIHIQSIFVGDPEKDGIPNYGLNDAITTIENLPLFLEVFNNQIPKSRRGLIINSLVIDKHLKMKHIYPLLKTLGENRRHKISFATLSPNQSNPKIFYHFFERGLLTTIPPQCNQLQLGVEFIKKNPNTTLDNLIEYYDPPKVGNFDCSVSFLFSEKEYQQNFDFIKLNAQNEFFFNDKKIAQEALFEKIKTIILEKKEKAIFIADVHDEVIYEHYFFLRHEHKRAMNEVRNQEALIRFGKKYEYLERFEQKEIRRDYPMMFQEFFSAEEKFIFDFFRNKNSES